MIRRIWMAYQVELSKAFRAHPTYLGPILVMLAVGCALFLQPVVRDGISDYAFIAYATPAALNLLGLLLLLVYSSGLISSELNSGSIRTILVRPLHRHEFVIAKFLLGTTYAAVLTLAVGLSSWVIAFALGEVSGVEIGGELLYTASEMRNAYGLGMLLSLAPQCAVVAYAVMLSTFTRNTGTAIASAVGLWVVFDMVKYEFGIGPYLFSTYLEMPWRVFLGHGEALDASWFPDTAYCLATSFCSTIVFLLIGCVCLSRRNLHA